MFVNHLKVFFIRDYSRKEATPRLEPELVQFFKHINAIAYFFVDLKKGGFKEQYTYLRSMLLAQMTEGEIEVTCYYYYVFYEIVNSENETLKVENPVKLSGVFEGNLFLSDDFSRNVDPRDKDGGFPDAIVPYCEQIAKLRIEAKERIKEIRDSSPEDYSEPHNIASEEDNLLNDEPES